MFQIDENIAQKIENDGFVIVKNVLSKEEISKLREIATNHFKDKGIPRNSGLTQPNAAVKVPEINWLFYHANILEMMRNLLKQEDIIFTSHCDLHCRTLSGWHKDDGMTVIDGGYFGQPMYDNQDSRVYKVAIYLQDHVYNQAGLSVKKGSHQFASVNQGEEVYLKTHAGDAIVFDVRLTHRGQKDIVPIPIIKKPIKLVQKVFNKVFKVGYSTTNHYFKSMYDNISGDRLSIFFTYGANNEYTKTFAIKNMKRQIAQNKSQEIWLNPNTRKKFLERNINLAEDHFNQLVSKSEV